MLLRKMSKNRIEPDIQLNKYNKSRKPSISDDDDDYYSSKQSSYKSNYPSRNEPPYQSRNDSFQSKSDPYQSKTETKYKSSMNELSSQQYSSSSNQRKTRRVIGSDSSEDEKPSSKNRQKSKNRENKTSFELDGRPTIYLFGCLIVAAFGASFQIGWTSNILDFRTYINVLDIVDNSFLSTDVIKILSGLFAAFYPLGAIFGAIFSGFLANGAGRKGALLIVNIFVIIGAAILLLITIIADSNSLTRFFNGPLKLIAKLVCGFYVGFFSGIIPIYLSEMPTKNIRGLCGVLNQVFILFGSLICAVSEQLRDIQTIPISSLRYQLTTVIAALVFLPLVVHIGMFFLSDSPARLIQRGKTERAREVLKKLRNEENTNLIESEIKEVEENETELDSSCCTRVFWILVVIQFAQHFTGIYAVTSEWKVIMAPKVENNKPLVSNYVEIIMGTQLGITLIAMFLVDRVGRKILLIVGYAGMGLSSILIGVAATAKVPDMAVVCAFLFIIFYAIGPGSISWLIVPECVTTAARGKTVSGVMSLNWFFLFVLTLISPILFEKIGFDNFYIFGSIGIASAIFVWVFLPETKKKSSSEIVKAFSEKTIFIKEIL